MGIIKVTETDPGAPGEMNQKADAGGKVSSVAGFLQKHLRPAMYKA